MDSDTPSGEEEWQPQDGFMGLALWKVGGLGKHSAHSPLSTLGCLFFLIKFTFSTAVHNLHYSITNAGSKCQKSAAVEVRHLGI